MQMKGNCNGRFVHFGVKGLETMDNDIFRHGVEFTFNIQEKLKY